MGADPGGASGPEALLPAAGTEEGLSQKVHPMCRESAESSLIPSLSRKGQRRASNHRGQSLRFDSKFKEAS